MNEKKIRYFFVAGILSLLFICVLTACERDSFRETGAQGSVTDGTATPTITATFAPDTPTPMLTGMQAPIAVTPALTATPTPFVFPKSWTAMNEENTLFHIPFTFYEGFGSTWIDWGDHILGMLLGPEEGVIVLEYEVETGRIVRQTVIPEYSGFRISYQVLGDGTLMLFDDLSMVVYILDQTLQIVNEFTLSTESCESFCLNDAGTMCYYMQCMEDGLCCVFEENLLTGERRDLTSGFDVDGWIQVKGIIFGHILVVTYEEWGSFETDTIFFDITENVICAPIETSELMIQNDGNQYCACVRTGLPELLFGDTEQDSCVTSLMYEKPDECSNYRFDWEESLLTTQYCEQIDEREVVYQSILRMYDYETGHLVAETTYDGENSNAMSAPFALCRNGTLALGIIYNEEESFLYAWDIEAAGNRSDFENTYFCSFIQTDEERAEMMAQLQSKADEIGRKYFIDLFVGDGCELDFDEFQATPCYEVRLVTECLAALDDTLSAYPDGFFEKLERNGDIPLAVYLVGSLVSQAESTIPVASAVYSMCNDLQYVAIDCTDYAGLEQTLYHELSHAIDWYIYEFETEEPWYNVVWNGLNPEGFTYDYDYVNNMSSGEQYTYLSLEESPDTTYFYDYYAKSYETEDRARLAEHCQMYGIEKFEDYPHLMKKIETMYQTICMNFGITDYFEYDEYFQ